MTIIDLFQAIYEGKYQIYFDSWFFSGGRGEDFTTYEVKEKENHICKIFEAEDSITTDTELNATEKDFFFSSLFKVLDVAWHRDDTELIQYMTTHGWETEIPCGYEDYKREDILKGEYDYED